MGGGGLGQAPSKLVSNDYCKVTFDAATRIVRFARTGVAIRSHEEAARLFGEAVSVIDTLGRAQIKLIIDVRDAPSRNDPVYERAMAEYRRQLARGVPRIAVIVRTAAGLLHARRLGKEDHVSQVVVSSESDAIAHLNSND